MTNDEFSDRIRSMIEHENLLRDQRINWLIASQGLLIAALALFWDKENFLAIALAVVGLLFSISIGTSLFSNTLAIRKLAAAWENKCKSAYDGPDVIALRSRDIMFRVIRWLYPWNSFLLLYLYFGFPCYVTRLQPERSLRTQL